MPGSLVILFWFSFGVSLVVLHEGGRVKVCGGKLDAGGRTCPEVELVCFEMVC